jgi:hypothetical protein
MAHDLTPLQSVPGSVKNESPEAGPQGFGKTRNSDYSLTTSLLPPADTPALARTPRTVASWTSECPGAEHAWWLLSRNGRHHTRSSRLVKWISRNLRLSSLGSRLAPLPPPFRIPQFAFRIQCVPASPLLRLSVSPFLRFPVSPPLAASVASRLSALGSRFCVVIPHSPFRIPHTCQPARLPA